MLKAQLSALAAATFRMRVAYDDHSVQVDAKVVSKFELWLNRDDSQRVLWPTTLRLSLDYYESLTRYAVPLDERAVAALAHSAMALDMYCWLAQRLYRPYEVVTDAGSQGKLVSERSRPGSAESAFHAAQAASTTASYRSRRRAPGG
jgi:hypothetical protein